MNDLMPVGPSLDLAVGAWLHAKAGKSGSTKTEEAYRTTLASFRAACRGAGWDLDGPVRELALLAQAWAAAGDPAAATYNQRLAIVSSFYTFAAKKGLLEGANPISRVDRRSVQEYQSARALAPDEVAARLKAIDRTSLAGQRDYALLAIAFQTGRRLSELAGLTWGDVTIQKDTITLTWTRTKGNKVMHDKLVPAVSKALGLWVAGFYGKGIGTLAATAPIWVSLARNGTRGHALTIDAIADIAQKHLGVSTVHSTRHTFAHAMEAAGAPPSEIQRRLGHSSLATTSRYLAALRSAENPQAAALAALLGLDE